MIIDGEESGRLSFPMEIPMDAFRHLADEIEYQIRDFQVGLEILEYKCLLTMDEECSVHERMRLKFDVDALSFLHYLLLGL